MDRIPQQISQQGMDNVIEKMQQWVVQYRITLLDEGRDRL
jgi:hypothetical protein